jgi:hypothetical protein
MDFNLLVLEFTAGTAYQGTGTDTTFIYSNYKGKRNKLAYVKDDFFKVAGNKVEQWHLDGGIDAGSPIWIDFASQYTTGTGTLKVILSYGVPSGNATIGVSMSQVAAITDLKAPLLNPTFEGVVTVPDPVNASDATNKGYVDGQVSFSLVWKEPVEDIVSTLANGITINKRYILSTNGHINVSDGDNTWTDLGATITGTTVYVIADGALPANSVGPYNFNGSSWVSIGTGSNHNDLTAIQGGAGGEYYHLTAAQRTVATQTATAARNGVLSSADWSTFNGKANLISPIFTTPNIGSATGSISGNAGTVTGFTPASGSLSLSGADALTLTTTAATNVTLPTSGTLATTQNIADSLNNSVSLETALGSSTALPTIIAAQINDSLDAARPFGTGTGASSQEISDSLTPVKTQLNEAVLTLSTLISAAPAIAPEKADTVGLVPTKRGDLFFTTDGHVYIAKSPLRGGWVLLNCVWLLLFFNKKNMRKILPVLFILVSFSAGATNYYVKTGGSDGANGLSDATAWATVNKVTGTSFTAGDSILFRRGDTFVSSSNAELGIATTSGNSGAQITYGAYGIGAKPIINARKVLANWNVAGSWTNVTGNIWSCTLITWGSTNQKGRLWINGTEAKHANSTTVPTATEIWTHNVNTTYVYSVGNPATTFSNVEWHGAVITVYVYSDYITLQDLDIRGGDTGIALKGSNCIIQRCNIGRDCIGMGIQGDGTNGTFGRCDNNKIRYNLFDTYDRIRDAWYAYNSYDGIFIGDGCSNWDTYENTFIDWGHAAYVITQYDGGVAMSGDRFHHNYITAPDIDYSRGFGVYGIGANKNFEIYDNIIYNTTVRNQINCDGAKIYNNVINTVIGLPYSAGNGQGIALEATGVYVAKHIEMYNNLIMNCAGVGIWIANWGNNDIINNTFTGNRLYNNDATDSYQIRMEDGVKEYQNVWKNNFLYKKGVTDLVYYGHSATNDYPHTVAEFNAENGTARDVISGNTSGDPILINSIRK